MENNRYHSLDSLRGIASLQVVICHCLMVLPAVTWLIFPETLTSHNSKFYIANSPLRFFWNGPPAVIVFFVLSGFVLSLPYYRSDKSPNYLIFSIKRILRLYIPCFVIILISLFLKTTLYRPNKLSLFHNWIMDMWTMPRGPSQLIDLFLLNTHFNDIEPALWTLPIELKLSLILPFFIFIQKRLNFFFSIFSVIACALLFHVLYHIKFQDIWGDFRLFYYFSFFALGSFLCKYKEPIINWINNLPKIFFVFFVIISIYIYTYQYSFWWLPSGIIPSLQKAQNYIISIAGAMFIIIAISVWTQKLFTSKLFLFLGKYSFSLYLIHEVIITSLAYIFDRSVNPNILIILSFGLSILLSILYYKLVEIPALNLGKTCADRFSKLILKRTHTHSK